MYKISTRKVKNPTLGNSTTMACRRLGGAANRFRRHGQRCGEKTKDVGRKVREQFPEQGGDQEVTG
jgi:hypothetical protein